MIEQFLRKKRIHLGIFILALKTHGDLWMSVKVSDTARYEGEATCKWDPRSTLKDQTSLDDLALDFSNLSLAD